MSQSRECSEPMNTEDENDFEKSKNSFGDIKIVRSYDNMSIEEIINTTQINTEVFENKRKYPPRKHRSCHKLAEPVPDEVRRERNSRVSREYTRRNREEIQAFREMYADVFAQFTRLQYLTSDLKVEIVDETVTSAIRDFEEIMQETLVDEPNIEKKFDVPSSDKFLEKYRKSAQKIDSITFKTPLSGYDEEYRNIRKEYLNLEERKNDFKTATDKSNYASSKCRLKQKMFRAQLKAKCHSIWIKTETLKLQAGALKKHSDILKKSVWENILVKYYDFMRENETIKNDFLKVDRIQSAAYYFQPFATVDVEFDIHLSSSSFSEPMLASDDFVVKSEPLWEDESETIPMETKDFDIKIEPSGPSTSHYNKNSEITPQSSVSQSPKLASKTVYILKKPPPQPIRKPLQLPMSTSAFKKPPIFKINPQQLPPFRPIVKTVYTVKPNHPTPQQFSAPKVVSQYIRVNPSTPQQFSSSNGVSQYIRVNPPTPQQFSSTNGVSQYMKIAPKLVPPPSTVSTGRYTLNPNPQRPLTSAPPGKSVYTLQPAPQLIRKHTTFFCKKDETVKSVIQRLPKSTGSLIGKRFVVRPAASTMSPTMSTSVTPIRTSCIIRTLPTSQLSLTPSSANRRIIVRAITRPPTAATAALASGEKKPEPSLTPKPDIAPIIKEEMEIKSEPI